MGRTKRLATSLHTWFGLTIGMVGLYLAATGGWLLFRPQADPLANPGYLTVSSRCSQPLSMDRLAEIARAAHPRVPIDSIWWKSEPAASLMVRYTDNLQSYLDRCTGRVLGLHPRWSGLFGFVEKLHRLLFLPHDVSGNVAGVIAIVMAAMMGGLGLFIWWPRRRAAWKPALTINGELAGRARTRNRHSVVGAFAAVGLLLSSVTGIAIGFDVIQAFLYTATGSVALETPKVAALPAGQPIALDAAWDNTLALLPTPPRTAVLRLPTAKLHAIELYFTTDDNPDREGHSYVYADAANGWIISYHPYDTLPLGQRLYDWILALHQGEIGGLPGQLAMLATMLAILYLGWSGVKSYVQKRLGQRAPIRMRVAAVRDEALAVKAFDLVPVARRRLPRAGAGAHIDVHVPGGPKRQYSLVNGPMQRDSFTIAVRLSDASRGGSHGLHGMAPGDELLVGSPRNHFPLPPRIRHATLIAAGIGITPLIAMARHLAARKIPFTLDYFGRTAEGMAYRGLLDAPPFTGRSTQHVGLARPAIADILQRLVASRPRGSHLFVCGPDAFMAHTQDIAAAAGWPAVAVHRENFAAPASTDTGPRETIDVTLARSGRKLVVATDESMLTALLDAGVTIPSSCEQGICGDCAVGVRAGDLDHRDCFLSEAQRARGDIILPCVSRARGALVLDA